MLTCQESENNNTGIISTISYFLVISQDRLFSLQAAV